jgi:hypothetical protein
LLILAVLVVSGSIGCVSVASASPVGKVFVCKYVGTPGTGERLQAGQNPIDVSINAIKDYAGVGSYFNDAQGRSFVLAEDVGQDEPDMSGCPVGSPDPTPSPSVTPDPTPTGTTVVAPTPSVTPTPSPTVTPSPAPSGTCQVLSNGHLVTDNICPRPSYHRTLAAPPAHTSPSSPVKRPVARKPVPSLHTVALPHPAVGPQLANTGTPVWGLIGLAALCLSAGLSLVVRSSRRH